MDDITSLSLLNLDYDDIIKHCAAARKSANQDTSLSRVCGDKDFWRNKVNQHEDLSLLFHESCQRGYAIYVDILLENNDVYPQKEDLIAAAANGQTLVVKLLLNRTELPALKAYEISIDKKKYNVAKIILESHPQYLGIDATKPMINDLINNDPHNEIVTKWISQRYLYDKLSIFSKDILNNKASEQQRNILNNYIVKPNLTNGRKRVVLPKFQ